MFPTLLAVAVLGCSSLTHGLNLGRDSSNYTRVCSDISKRLSSSSTVYYPGSPGFEELSAHSLASSTETPACVIAPGPPTDIGVILRAVGETRTPFAVQGGGHTANLGFSSTKGVHISMNNSRSIIYDATSMTVEFGTGLVWDDLYSALEPHGAIVLGARNLGVGVGGLTLGGGYSWYTNQYGLTIDTVVAFEVVKPDGTVSKVTEKSDPQLFFGLKGGLNNFGAVTKITLKTYPQGQIWGGSISYGDPTSISAFSTAISKFSSQVTDPKAGLITSYTHVPQEPATSAILFYDGPTPPPGIFDDLLNIPSTSKQVKTQSFLSFLNDSAGVPLSDARACTQGVPVPQYSVEFLNLVANITTVSINCAPAIDHSTDPIDQTIAIKSVGRELENRSLYSLTLIQEPFLPSILSHSTSASAYPFTRAKFYTPTGMQLTYRDSADDQVFKDTLDKIATALFSALAAEGYPDAEDAPRYSNYASSDTPVSKIYGTNLPALKVLKKRVDPLDVMGLSGGFKIRP